MNYSLSHGTPILSGLQIHIAILPYMHFSNVKWTDIIFILNTIDFLKIWNFPLNMKYGNYKDISKFLKPRIKDAILTRNTCNTLLFNFGNYFFTRKTSCFPDFYN